MSREGAEFLPYAREMLLQEQAARAALGLESPMVTGTLRFAAPSSFAQCYIAPLVPEFLGRHPGLGLDLRLSDTPFDPIEGSFDLALRSAVLADSSLKARKLADDERILCASPDYVARNGMPAHPRELPTHELIAFRNQAPRQLTGPDGAVARFDPGGAGCRLVVDDGASQKIATMAGAGISMNSLWSVHREIAEGTLVQVLPGYEVEDDVALWLVYPQSNVLTAKVRTFIDYLLEEIGKAPPWRAA